MCQNYNIRLLFTYVYKSLNSALTKGAQQGQSHPCMNLTGTIKRMRFFNEKLSQIRRRRSEDPPGF